MEKNLYELAGFRSDPVYWPLLQGGRPGFLTPETMEILLVLVWNGNCLTTKFSYLCCLRSRV